MGTLGRTGKRIIDGCFRILKPKPKPRIIRATKIKPKIEGVPAPIPETSLSPVIKTVLGLLTSLAVAGTVLNVALYDTPTEYVPEPIDMFSDVFGPVGDAIRDTTGIGVPYELIPEDYELGAGGVGYDGDYLCTATTESPLGTSTGQTYIDCIGGYCGESTESFVGTVDPNGNFLGEIVVRFDIQGKPLDTVEMTGTFSLTERFTLRGSGRGVTETFVCEKI